MNQILLLTIAVPMIAAVICLVLPRRTAPFYEVLALITSAVTLLLVGYTFTQSDLRLTIPWLEFGPRLIISFDLRATWFGQVVLMAASIITFLVLLYSIPFARSLGRRGEYYSYFLFALGSAAGAFYANNWIVLLFFWELLGLFLVMSITITGQSSIPAVIKTLIIAGIGDLSLMLGVVLLWSLSGTSAFNNFALHQQTLSGWLPNIIFLCLLVAAFAKAGIMPLHSWIPTVSTEAQATVMSGFTGFDKLMGIYFLARLTFDWFVIDETFKTILMAVGCITLLAGVLMAMVQHDFRRMLAFHSISQVGYMVLGIGTGTAVGIIGGLFHLFNMVVLKGNLFLCGGSVQHQTGRTEFASLGGLARAMPWTFVCTLTMSLGIAGVPPLNAFVSKWLIYQGIIDRGGKLFPVYLLIAMFGSALTLASFLKLLYSMFWGDRPSDLKEVHESSPWMIAPMVILSLVTIGTGVAYVLPVNAILVPILGPAAAQFSIVGLWNSGFAALLLILSLLVGLIIYWAGRPRGVQETEVFLGGEVIPLNRYRVTGTQFYGPIKHMQGLANLYALADRGVFDVYNYITNGLKWIGQEVYTYIDESLAELYQQVIPTLFAVVGVILRRLNSRSGLTYGLWTLYAVAIIAALVFPVDPTVISVVRMIASIGMIGWAILALVETDLMHLLVLATTSQFGIVVLGFTLSPSTAITYLITSGIALGILYACSRSFVHALGTSQLGALMGVATRAPGLFYLFLLAAFWLAGLPPLGNFFGKYVLGTLAGEADPLWSYAISGTAILTLGYLIRPIRNFLTASGKDVPTAAGAH